jgi:Fe-S-cluster containining protein
MAFEYPENVRFFCTKCGICCRNTHEKFRHILLMRTEAEEIAKTLKKPVSEFAEKVKAKAPYVYEMRKIAEGGACVFLKENQCTIYAKRPLICRFYPFELKNTQNQSHKFVPTEECPGLAKGRRLNEQYFRKLFKTADARMRLERKSDET